MAKLSVLIPLYNKEKDIKNTIESVLNQTFSDFELLVINDGSTDKSEQVVKEIDDARIKVFSKPNEGVALTRNYGVERAATNLIAFLDADDFWHSNHLENLYQLTTQFPKSCWFATAYEKKYNSHHTTTMSTPILKQGKDWAGIVNNYFKYSLIDTLAWTSAVGMKKDFFIKLGGFDASITHGAGEDTDLWVRAALKSPLVFSNKVTATYNLQGSNRISKTATLKRNFMNFDKYNAEASKDPFLKSYLDLNRYSIAIKYKLAGDLKSFNKYVNQLDHSNLSSKQRFIIKQPTFVLKVLLQTKFFFEEFGMRLTSFK